MARQISISAILEDLKNGMTRKDINAKYELNPIDIKKLWSHEKLKNKKTAKYVSELEIIDDITVDYGDLPANRHAYVAGPIADSSKSFE